MSRFRRLVPDQDHFEEANQLRRAESAGYVRIFPNAGVTWLEDQVRFHLALRRSELQEAFDRHKKNGEQEDCVAVKKKQERLSAFALAVGIEHDPGAATYPCSETQRVIVELFKEFLKS